MQLIDKDVLVAKIESYINDIKFSQKAGMIKKRNAEMKITIFKSILSFINTLEVKEVDLENNGWIDCRKQMPSETNYTSYTLQGHREWTESDLVLAWDSMYGCRVDATKNGKWMSEQIGGYTGQVLHEIIAWRPIPAFS